MTLIITTVCRDGICVCADKRRTIRFSDGRVVREDSLYKIYKFKDIPLIIFNHAVNIINGKWWDILCSEYENSQRWENKDFRSIVDDFKQFIEDDVLSELSSNELSNAIGFVICGKTPYDSAFMVYELFWGPDFERKSHDGIVRTGDGSKYLNRLFDNCPEMNTVKYWRNKGLDEAKEEVVRLFALAVEEKKRVNGEEFSDGFDIDTVP